MHIRRPAAGFEAMIALLCLALSGVAEAAPRFQLEKDAGGQVRPFRVISLPLADFVREYSRFTSTPIATAGSWEEDVKGSVTLFLRHPLKADELTEIFHRVLADNGYAIVDAPAGNGWIIEKGRDARDAALPVYDATETPDSSRLVTTYRNLKHIDAEIIARNLRSFMPANSRIIPSSRGQVFITDTASNIRRLNEIIARMDTPEAAQRLKGSRSDVSGRPNAGCGETRIEKLVVENFEVSGSGGSGFAIAPDGTAREKPRFGKPFQGGARR